MPCILKIKVVAARDLPVMDKASELADAYAEVRFADYDVVRTSICRKTLNPIWNEDFRIEVSDDSDLQNEPLEIKVLDYDAISTNNAVGGVTIDLNPLLVSWDMPAPDASSSAVNVGYAFQNQSTVSAPTASADDALQTSTVPTSSVATTMNMALNNTSASAVAGQGSDRQISGWFPIYDTLRGIRGEINVQVKLSFFGDSNPFKDSSAGVQVFSAACLPSTHRVLDVLGFVDVLLTEDDPEFHWVDSFRTQRSSNEARQKVYNIIKLTHAQLLYQMSGQLKRLLGRQVLEMGGNAVVGFRQHFDLEESIITARAIGTCIKLGPQEQTAASSPLQQQVSLSSSSLPTLPPVSEEERLSNTSGPSTPNADARRALQSRQSRLSRMVSIVPDQLETSASDPISPNFASPIDSADPGSYRNSFVGRNNSIIQKPLNNPIHEYKTSTECQIYTLERFPEGVIVNLGGIVSAKSVKLIQTDESDVRDNWWSELRDEVKSHAKTLGCNAVVGYIESATVNDDLYVLSATGTAAVVDWRVLTTANATGTLRAMADEPNFFETPTERQLATKESARSLDNFSGVTGTESTPRDGESTVTDTLPGKRRGKDRIDLKCRALHIPYQLKSAPFPINFSKCALCQRRHVPEILITNVEPLLELEAVGDGYLIEAFCCRSKKRKEGESNASTVSDSLPFIEYDIHRQLMYKLRIQGLNAIFGLQIQLTIGDDLIVAVASGTATYLAALPPPPPLRISRNLDVVDAEDRQLLEIQRRIMAISDANRERLERTLSRRLQSAESSVSIPPLNDESAGDLMYGMPRASDPAPQFYPQVQRLSLQPSSLQFSSPQSVRSSRLNTTKLTTVTGDDSDCDSSDASDDGQLNEGVGVPATNVVVQVDDDADEDLMAVLLDPQYPDNFQLCNTEHLPPSDRMLSVLANLNALLISSRFADSRLPFNAQMITIVKEGAISAVSHHPNRQLAAIFRELYDELQVSLSFFKNCLVTGIQYDIQLPHENEVHVRLSAMAIGDYDHIDLVVENEQAVGHVPENSSKSLDALNKSDTQQPAPSTAASNPVLFQQKSGSLATSLSNLSSSSAKTDMQSDLGLSARQITMSDPDALFAQMGSGNNFVDLTPLAQVPGCTIVNHFGRLSIHFVKEDLNLHHFHGHHYTDAFYNDAELDDGLGTFIHKFLMEAQAVARAHALAMGGNAVVAFRVERSYFRETLKNQAYALMSISGDVVEVRRDAVDGVDPATHAQFTESFVEQMWSSTKIAAQ